MPISPVRDPLPVGSLLEEGRFTIGALVGEGSFSLTYAAMEGPWRLPVAIKEFFPQGCQRQRDQIVTGGAWDSKQFAHSVESFLQEGAMLERFHHPGIVRVLSMFRAHGTAYLVEELLEGVTLGEGLARAGAMPASRVLEMAQQVGQALLLVHAGGLVHSDVKPDNLFLCTDGRYVLLDFGAARGYLSRAKVGQAAVSPGYSPPEQYELNQKLTPAADVYALAATVYHLLSGQVAPDARLRSKGEMLCALDVPPRLSEGLLAALILDSQQRTPTIRAFLDAIGVDTSHKAYRALLTPFERRTEQLAHPGGVYALALHAPTGRLFSAGRDGTWRSWSWPDLHPLAGGGSHEVAINALAVSQDGAYLVTGAADGSVKLWSAQDTGPGHELLTGGPAILCLAFSGSMGLVAASMGNGGCCLLGPSLAEPIRWSAHQGAVNGLALHPSEPVLATAGDDKSVHLWSLPEGNYLGSLLGHTTRIQSLSYVQDGSGLLTGCSDLSVRLWELTSGREIRSLRGHKAMVWAAQPTCLAHLVVTASGDGCLRAFRLSSGRLLLQSEAHDGWVRALVVDPQRPWLASGGGDGKICLWAMPPEVCM